MVCILPTARADLVNKMFNIFKVAFNDVEVSTDIFLFFGMRKWHGV